MSINMTQAFEFETDDVESLIKMVNTIGSILFDGTKIIISKEADDFNFCFNDGKYDGRNEYSVFRKSVLVPDRTLLGVSVCEEVDCFHKQKEAIEHASKLNRGLSKDPTRKFLMCIATNCSDYKGGKKYAGFKTGQKYIEDTVRELLNNFDHQAFYEECGDGYNGYFDGQDGDVGIGYRLNWSPSGAEDRLHLSLIHMYYGK